MKKTFVITSWAQVPDMYEGPISYGIIGKIFHIKNFCNYKGNFVYDYHRLDGPAIIDPSGRESPTFWINDKGIRENEFWKHPLVIENTLQKILELK